MPSLKNKILSAIILTVFFSPPFHILFAADIKPLDGRKIMLDPGHATLDPKGSIVNLGRETAAGYKEHKLNLEISEKLKELLTKQGATIVMTRTRKDYWREGVSAPEDNKGRGFFANEIGADATLSIHCDWHPNNQYSGVTTYYYKKNSRWLGSLIQQNLVHNLEAKDRGLVRDSFSILEAAEMPAVLIEVGYLSNDNEAKKLLSLTHQDLVVKAISNGLITFFAK